MNERNRLIIEVEEWKKKSENGEVCGILGCESKPTVSCPHCGNWYCEDHSFVLQLPSHPANLPTK